MVSLLEEDGPSAVRGKASEKWIASVPASVPAGSTGVRNGMQAVAMTGINEMQAVARTVEKAGSENGHSLVLSG